MYKSIYLKSEEWFDGPPPPTPPKASRVKPVVLWIMVAAAGMMLITVLIALVLRWTPPPTTAFMLQSGVSDGLLRYQWVPWDRMSPHLAIAAVAAEDQKFPHHWGFDFDAISKAVDENKRRARPRGASTITQQVAKNLFLWSGKSYLRKGLEAYFTVLIELVWPKRRILEVYLNIAQFGHGIYGVEAASRAFFDKSAVKVLQSEAALLAAVLPNPKKLKAGNPSDYVHQRVREIEAQMELLGGPSYLKEM